MLITITIRLKDGVLDPEGRAIESALKNLGYTEASAISVGRIITLDINEPDRDQAHRRASQMCETLLVNTVIEDYEISITPTQKTEKSDQS